VIEAWSEPVIAELARRFDPSLEAAAVPLSLGGEQTVGQLIGAWRDEAWRNGIALRDARSASRASRGCARTRLWRRRRTSPFCSRRVPGTRTAWRTEVRKRDASRRFPTHPRGNKDYTSAASQGIDEDII
jgi:hypothetical protein